MAVSLNMGSCRTDQFSGSVNLSQRVEVQQNTQGSGFAQLLGSRNTANAKLTENSSSGANVGSVNSSGAIKTDASAGGTIDLGNKSGSDFDAALASVDAVIKDTVVEKVIDAAEKADASELETVIARSIAAIPQDTMELARAIVRGNIKIEDVPADRITFELLKAILLAKFELKLEEDEDAEDPKEKSQDQSNPSTVIDVQLAVLYKLIDAYTEMRYDENTDSTGIMERIREVSEMLDEKGKNAELTDILAQILNDRIEAASKEANVDTFGRTDEIVKETENNTLLEEFLRDIRESLGEELSEVLEDAINSGDIGEITKAVKQVAESMVKPEVEAPRTVVKSAVSEELEMLRNAKQNSRQSDDILKEFGIKLENTEEKVEAAVNVQTSDSNSSKQDTNSDSNPGAAAAVHEAPVVFRTDDGVELEVQPSEVVSQAIRLVEQAVQDTAKQTEYSLVLNPGELGRITVKMIKAADGAVSVTIAAENSHTQRILEENSSLMQSNLRNNGIQLENWQTVSESRQETLAQDYNGSSKNPYYREEQNTEEQEPGESFAEIIAAM